MSAFCCCFQGKTKDDTRELPSNEILTRGASTRGQIRPPSQSVTERTSTWDVNVDGALGSSLFLTLQPRISSTRGEQCDKKTYKMNRIGRECIDYDEMLTAGWFGNIFFGRARPSGNSGPDFPVVVRELNIRHGSELEKARFLSDLTPHLKLKEHENILNLVGLNIDTMPFLAVFAIGDPGEVPASPEADLRAYLLQQRDNGVGLEATEGGCMAMDIACGLTSLHDAGFVHHDLSTRSCCYINGRVKIGEIGWSEYKYKDDYVMCEGDVVPLRWLDPFAVRQSGVGRLCHSQCSNIWAFGVTMWEITSGCELPYASCSNQDLLTSLMRPATAEDSPDFQPPDPGDLEASRYAMSDLKSVIRSCWYCPEERPKLFDCIQRISRVFHPSRRTSALPQNRDLGVVLV